MKTIHRLARPLLAAALTLFATVPPALAAPAIPNPGFETDTFTVVPGYVAVNKPITGWTANPTNRIGQNIAGNTFFANNGVIPNGTRVAFIESHGFPSTLSTTITGLVAGTSYRVQFRANGKVSETNPVTSIRFNGGTPVNFTVTPVDATGVFTSPYRTINAIFTATGATALMEITNSTTQNSALLVDSFSISAATAIQVTNTNDSGAGSLRAALATAAGTAEANAITFAAALSGQTITLASEIVVNDAGGVIIDASSPTSGLTIDGGAGTNRIFSVATGALMSLRRLTLTGGNGTGAAVSGRGGAILNQGTLSLTGCALFTNTANRGGAIHNTGGQLALTQCTLSNNSNTGDEGGALRSDGGTVALTHCSISGNTSQDHGGGITNYPGSALTITNTIIAGNGTGGDADIDNFGGTVTRVGANIVQNLGNGNGGTDTGPAAINANPLLSALADNGGPTRTMAIAYTSPALNASVGSTVTTDQRGLPVVGTPDIGAFEMQAGVFSLSAATYKTLEGSVVTVTINRTDGFSGTAKVRVFTTNGTAGATDFTGRPNTAVSDVTFFDGDPIKSVDIPTATDSLAEGNETFFVSLGSPTPPGAATLGSPSSATVTIVDPILVTNTNDDGPGSLRQALAAALANSGPDVIHFISALNGLTITLGSEIFVTDAGGVTVDASNLPAGLTIDGGPGNNRVIGVNTGATLALRRLTLTGGNGFGALFNGFRGGALFNQGNVTLTDCTITGNSIVGDGAGLHNTGGTMTLVDCTVSNNISSGGSSTAAGIDNTGGTLNVTSCTFSGNQIEFAGSGTAGAIWSSGTTTISHSTFTANSANGSSSAGGLRRVAGTFTVSNSIIAGNTGAGGATADVSGAFTSGGNNLVGIVDSGTGFGIGGDQTGTGAAPLNALLGPLAANGGPTKTHALLGGSPAKDAATGSGALADQRGFPIVNMVPDIGAFEVQGGGVFVIDTVTNPAGYTPAEALNALVIVRRTGGFSGVATVQFTTTSGSATLGADFTNATQLLTFNGNEDTKIVPIAIANDGTGEPVEFFNVTLSAPSAGTSLGSPSTAKVFIIDPSATVTTPGGDLANPVVTAVSAPAAGASINVDVDNIITVSGTATDNKGVALVQASLNGGAPVTLTRATPGAPSTTFTGAVPGVIPGTNTLVVTARDFANRTSAPFTRTFKALRPLFVKVSGNGSVTPAGTTPKSFKEVGQSVTLTATPGAGAMFSNWNILSANTTGQLGILASALQKPTLSFIHREGLALRANFVVNPYPAFAAAGAVGTDYTGLIHADTMGPSGTGPSFDTEGLLTVTLMSTGAFSGSIKMGGTTLPAFAGSFDPAGVARFGTARSTSIAIVRSGKPSLRVALTIDLSPGRTKDTIFGTITATNFLVSQVTAVSIVTADRAFYDGATTIVPPAYLGASNATQAYTAVFPQLNNGGLGLTDYPQGDGYGFLTVSRAGLVTLTSGKLADGTMVSGSFKLSKENKFPLFLQLYPSGTLTRGYLGGDVTLNAMDAGSDMSALSNLKWLRPSDNTQHYYPAGWPGMINVGFMGARYATAFTPASSVLRKADGGDGDLIGDALNAPDLVNGNATLSFSDGKLSGTIAKLLNITTTNMITKVPANDAGFTLNAFMLANGAFTGKFVHELDAGVPAPVQTDFQGALYQKGVNAGGYGFFLTRKPTPIDFLGESGAVTLFGAP